MCLTLNLYLLVLRQAVHLLRKIGCVFLFATFACLHTAAAHAVFDRAFIGSGQIVRLSIAIEHGCNGSPTTALRAILPEGLIVTNVFAADGMSVETKKSRFERNWNGPQGSVSEGIKEIIWSGAAVPDKKRGEFPFEIFVSSDLPLGHTLAVPVTQNCENGSQSWIEQATTPEAQDRLKSPAPLLRVVKPEQAHLDIRNGRSRVTPNGAPVAGGYITIRNMSDKPDRLVAATLPLAARAEIHEMSMTDGIMRMRALDKGLEIPAGGTVELKQGSYHLMFIKPSRAFVEGEWIDGTLTFERAGTLPVRFKVEAVGGTNQQSGAGHQHHAH
jgi:copper(I)-binding protein